MKIAQLFILVLAFLIIRPTQAAVLIEPVLGYNFGNFEVDESGFKEEKLRGASYGGRLGYQNLGFQLGLDYLKSNLDVDDNDYKDLETSEWAGFVGFEFPVLLRVYAGYIFSAEGNTKYNGVKTKLTDGTGTKLGLGFTGLPFIDINFEYRRGTFKEAKFGSTKENTDTDYSAFMVGVSLPFTI